MTTGYFADEWSAHRLLSERLPAVTPPRPKGSDWVLTSWAPTELPIFYTCCAKCAEGKTGRVGPKIEKRLLQCARLGHDCDYEPRVKFKDETQDVMNKNEEFIAAGSPVWNFQLPALAYGTDRSRQDSFPIFSSLSTDEDRERKAELHKPGTFLVIANSSSFTCLPEYCDDGPATQPATYISTRAGAHIYDQRSKRRKIQVTTESTNDENIIILKAFEDRSRRSPTATFLSSVPPPIGIIERRVGRAHVPSNEFHPSKIDEARQGGRDAHLLEHYRLKISPIVIKLGLQSAEDDAFEIEARTFPPLFHAMMAISALSLTHGAGSRNAEALEHYQKVIPAMREFVRSEEDSYADGALFTHYLLLLYDIASAGPQESNMWQSHSYTLRKIITRRRQVNHSEPHGFLVWVICLVDTYALLSGSGDGVFTEFVLKNNILYAHNCLPPLQPGNIESFFPEELPYFPGILELNQEVLSLALNVGKTARIIRTESVQQLAGDPFVLGVGEHPSLATRRRHVQEIQALCRSLPAVWEVNYPQYWSMEPAPKTLPRRVRGFYNHIYALYRACIVYAHTSMYPGQMGDIVQDGSISDDIPIRVTELIELGRQAVAEKLWELQYMPFSLFLAGVASKRSDEKKLALELMTELEQQSYGGNTTSMRRLLKAIYDKQVITLDSGVGNLNIDWIDEMRKNGLRLVMFGV